MPLKSSQYMPALQEAKRIRATRGERVMGALFPTRGMAFPSNIGTDNFKAVAHFRHWVYVAVNSICNLTAQLMPNMAYVTVNTNPEGSVKKRKYITESRWVNFGNGTPSLIPGNYYRKALGNAIKPHEEIIPLESQHPLRWLLENPNAIDTTFDLLYELNMFCQLCGVGYLWMPPNKAGFPCELWVIPSHWVWPRTGAGDLVDTTNPWSDQWISYYEIRPYGGMSSAGMVRFPPSEVLQFTWKNPQNKVSGYSKLWAGSEWIDTEESISKSRWAQFINQARPEFHIELGEGYNDPDDDRLRRIEAKFMSRYQGEQNYGKPIFTPPGSKITVLSFTPQEMAYVTSEDQIRDMILSLFGVPKAAVGISENMTFGSVLAVLMQYANQSINPCLTMMGQRLTKGLAARFESGKSIRIWYDDCSPIDPTQLNEDIKTDWACLAISPDEIRALRSRTPWNNGGEDPYTNGPGGMVPVPLQSGMSTDWLAQLTAPMSAAEEPKRGELDATGSEANAPAEIEADAKLANPKIDEPNGNPHKSWHFKTKDGKPHKFASTQSNITGELRDRIVAFGDAIPGEHLAEDGREERPHVTILYGLHTSDATKVAGVLRDQSPIKVKLGETTIFPAVGDADYDVLYIAVDSPDLVRLNKLLRASLPHTLTHGKYVPHVCLAYLKAGLGEQYANDDTFAGEEFVLDTVVFSDQQANKTAITLGGKPTKRLKSASPDISALGEELLADLLDGWQPGEQEKASYFADCDRDEHGHCKPSGRLDGSPAEKLVAMAADIPAKLYARAKDKAKQTYDKFEQKYGRKTAIAILASAIAGSVIPLPGSTLLMAAPVIAAAEMYKIMSGSKPANRLPKASMNGHVVKV